MDSESIINLMEGGFPVDPTPGDVIYRYYNWSLYPFVMLKCDNMGEWCNAGTQPGFVDRSNESVLELGLRKMVENEQQRNR